MAITLSDSFDDALGRWYIGSQSWDSTQRYDAEDAFLSSGTFSHVDLRSFHNDDISRRRTMGEIDTLTMATIEGASASDPDDSIYDTMAELDALVMLPGEDWQKSGTGFGTMTVAPVASLRNWRGLTMQTSGAAINTIISSGIPVVSSVAKSAPIDLSGMATLSSVFAGEDVSFFDNTSYIQLTSNPDGTFGTSAYNSATSAFSNDIGSTPNELRVNMSTLTSGAGASFSAASVTGVRFQLTRAVAPSAGLTFRLMSIRGLTAGWSYRHMDFNTRLGAITQAVSLTGVVPTIGPGSGNRPISLVRGSGAADDPRPSDAALLAYFANGENPVSTDGANKIDLIFREQKNSTANTGSSLRAQLKWDDADTTVTVWEEDTDGGTATAGAASTITNSGEAWTTNEWAGATVEIISGTGAGQSKTVVSNTATALTISGTWSVNPASGSVYQIIRSKNSVDNALGIVLDEAGSDPDDGRYLFRASLVGTAMTLEIIKTTAGLTHTSSVYNNTFSDGDWTVRGGRVGIHPQLYLFDTYIDQFSSASVGYATLRTKVYPSRKPVDGLRLEAAYSVDENMFNTIHWVVPDEQFIDNTKTISGRGSYRTNGGVYTNEFLVEDWTNTYIDFYVWVPASVNETNQPTAYVVNTDATIKVKMPKLQPSQWNRVRVELFPYSNYATGRFYQLLIRPAEEDINLTEYWVDAIKIGRRTVAWQGRAKSGATWRDFYGSVNNSRAALHFPASERGTELQLQAVALSPDAWIASFKMQPRYASLGNLTFDYGAEH